MFPTIRQRTAVLTAIVLLTGLVPAAGAFHSDTPVLHESGGPGTGWASYAFTTDGTPVEHEIEFDHRGLAAQFAFLLFEPDGAFIDGVILTAYQSGTGAHLDLQPPGTDRILINTYEDEAKGFSGLAATTDVSPGTYKMLVWSAGEPDAWTYRVRAEHGATVDAVIEGSDTFLHRARDFEGTVSMQASAGLPGVRAQVNATQVVEIEDRFFGRATPGGGLDELNMETPSGEIQRCSCYAWQGGEPGTYTFELTGVGYLQPSDVFVGGADATLVGVDRVP